jgi:hypothetical protein
MPREIRDLGDCFIGISLAWLAGALNIIVKNKDSRKIFLFVQMGCE